MNGKPVAVITGASRGIGRAITLALAGEGYDIVAIARSLDSEGMETLAPEIENSGADFFPIGLDISCTSCQVEVVKNILERYGGFDMLVIHAGVAPLQRTDLLDLHEESYDRVMNINLRGPLFFTQRIAREMIWLKPIIQEYRPRIVFISSVSSYISSAKRGEYCISKAGLSMAAQVFAERLTTEGIMVFEVRPGIIQTDMTARVKEKYDRMIEEGIIRQKRWGMPSDVAKAVASLARGDWDFSSGAVFEVSGGLNIRSL